jgi:hypothetical protein
MALDNTDAAALQRGTQDANALQVLFETQQSLTTYHEEAVQAAVEIYRALRETDTMVLRARAGWDADRTYIPDPLAQKISESFADMLFGEDPVITSAQTVAEKAAQQAKIRQQAAADVAQRSAAPSAPGTPTPAAAPPMPVDPDDATFPTDAPSNTLEEGDGPDSEDQTDTNADVVNSNPQGDQELLDNIVEANDLPSELRSSEVVCSSEGEVWWRIYVDQGQSDYPIVEWSSRANTRPLFRGRKLIACAFIDEIHREEMTDQWRVWRYVQVQATGIVRNLLYMGNPKQLGTQVSLDSRPETAELEEEWHHQIGILCGRIPNALGRDRRFGVSDYRNVIELLFSLNEGTTIGHENMRLTAKRRVVVPREALTEDGTFDASEDIIVVDSPMDDQLGGAGANAGGRFTVLEYSYDSQALIEQKLDTVATILNRCGIVAEMGSGGGGRSGGMGGGAAALSGTALRMRLIPTTLAANGKARYWDDQLPKILMRCQQVDAMPVAEGGFGRPWAVADEPPAVERSQPLPTDETEETTRHVQAVGGEIESRRSAIADLHPDWDDAQVQEELAQIQYELKQFGPINPQVTQAAARPQIGNGGGGSESDQA